jgi:hypothetical protein
MCQGQHQKKSQAYRQQIIVHITFSGFLQIFTKRIEQFDQIRGWGLGNLIEQKVIQCENTTVCSQDVAYFKEGAFLKGFWIFTP